MEDFLAMGGYGRYVWAAFGVTAAVVVFNLMAARRRSRIVRQRLLARISRRKERATKP